MKISDVAIALEKLSPKSEALNWDNIGLMVGDFDSEVNKILVTLDVDEDAVEKAVLIGADLIVSHHPLIFGKISKVTNESLTGKRIISLIKNDIACYSMHTNFDICGSMGQIAADTLDLENAKTLEVTNDNENGLGKIAFVEGNMTAKDWALKVKKDFGLSSVKIFGPLDKVVKKVAIYPGSGKDSIDIAIEQGADILITGDIGHHAGIDAKAMGLTVIDAGHYGIEHIFIKYIKEYLNKEFPNIIVEAAEICHPFEVI